MRTHDASDGQRELLRLIADDVRRIRLSKLDLDWSGAAPGRGRLRVDLRHRSDPEQDIRVLVEGPTVDVVFGVEHQHFDDVTAAVELIAQLLRGRVELEVREGVLVRRTRCSWIEDDGSRTPFLSGTALAPQLRRRRRRTVRFDFGARAAGVPEAQIDWPDR